jgi:hypothetical protein
MTNNRELSQIANLIEVLDDTRHINVKSAEGQNIGIGTTIPQYKVQVIGDVGVSQNTIISGNLRVSGITTLSSRVGLESDLLVAGITTSGIVDVNTNLTVNGQANLLGLTTTRDFSVVGVATFNTLNVGTGGTVLQVNSDGSVGIGTSLRNVNINSNLNVNGNAAVSGIFTADSINIQSGVGYAQTSGISTVSQGLTGSPSISVSNFSASGVSTFSGGSVDIFGSNQLRFNSAAFNINHDGVNANIFNGLGKLILGADAGNSISLERVGVATLARFTHTAGSELFFNGTKRFETTAYGGLLNGLLSVDNLNSSGISTFEALSSSNLQVSGITTTTDLRVGSAGTTIYTVSGIGSVGFGTTAPASQVEISRRALVDTSFITSANPYNYQLLLNNSSTGIGAWSGLAFGVSTINTTIGAAIAHIRTGANSQGSLNFYTRSGITGTALTHRMVVDTGVGIGTTQTVTDFHVEGSSYFKGPVGFNTTIINSDTQVDFGFDNNVFFDGFVNVGLAVSQANIARVNFIGSKQNFGGFGNLLVTSNNPEIPTTIFSGINGGILSLFAGGLLSSSRRGGQIDFVGGGSSIFPGEILFRTGTETGGIPQPITARLDTDGILYANTFTSTSDERLKVNIKTIDDPFIILNEIKGVRFNWKDGGDPSVGVIAQDVEKVLPEAVKTDPEGMKSVCYDMLIGVLIEAIKDQQKRIDDLEMRLNVNK